MNVRELYPFSFHPIFKERVWGGRTLETLYRKALPGTNPIGESWEIADRPGDESLIANGPLAGKSLSWLMANHAADLLGSAAAPHGRFPLLVKILDAREKLSLQVHPPAARAAELGGEPKTEMWYVADADPGAELYVGLKRGVTRAVFEHEMRSGDVAGCFHRILVKPGDAMFLPSGRVHAIGAGLVIFEIQQNSDTTYRVSDWGRVGLDGKPRELHRSQSLASIDFEDFEPALAARTTRSVGAMEARTLASDPLFHVELWSSAQANAHPLRRGAMAVIGVVSGLVTIVHGGIALPLGPGQFGLIPACLTGVDLRLAAGTSFLQAGAGPG